MSGTRLCPPASALRVAAGLGQQRDRLGELAGRS